MEISYPSDTKGQLYIPKVNSILWLGCSMVVLYFRSGARMESAYGLAITVTMLMTTLLISVYLRKVRRQGLLSWLVLLVFGAIETVFFISSLGKFTHGGYVTVILTLLLVTLEVIWYRGTQLEQKYKTRLRFADYIPNIRKLRDDTEIPMTAHNLVYLDGESDTEFIDRDILYSILDKNPKRAAAYWFVNVNVLNDPETKEYHVETYGTDFIYRVRLDLGFRCSQSINVYLRQIVRDLQETGELPAQDKKYSIYGESTVGTFQFCMVHKSVTTKTELSIIDEIILNAKYLVRRAAGSKDKWYGLDTSVVTNEYVPLITGGDTADSRIVRVE